MQNLQGSFWAFTVSVHGPSWLHLNLYSSRILTLNADWDPDPPFDFYADPAFHYNAGPDPQNDADPDPQHW